MQKRAALVFSFLFHPLVMTSLGLFIMFNSGSSLAVVQDEVKKISMIIVLLFTLVFPVGTLIMLKLTRMISKLELTDPAERLLPLSLILILYLFNFFVMRGIPQLERAHILFLLSPSISLFVLLALNKRIVSSFHMLGWGNLLGMLLIVTLFYRAPLEVIFIFATLGAGITGTARLILGHADLRELAAGFFTGFLITSALIIFFPPV